MYRSLDSEKTIATLRILANRIDERFPGASLSKVCRELLAIAEETSGRIRWLSRSLIGIRIAVVVVITGGGYLGFTLARYIRLESDGFRIEELEAATNAVVLIGAALLFLFTLETRIKRRRTLHALHELRAISHVIDMHQLTKDPGHVIAGSGQTTPSSPVRTLTPFQLTRYLDYCSEMLSFVGKLAALYAQSISDSVVLQAVNDIETLTNSISRRIWQKIMILDNDLNPPGPLTEPTPVPAPSATHPGTAQDPAP